MLSARTTVLLAACGLIAAGARAQDTPAPEQLQIGGSTIDVTFGPGSLDLPKANILDWVTNAGQAVAEYFGKFPVSHARILVRPVEGRSGVFNGTTWGNLRGRGPFTRISIGQLTDQQDLDTDWMMTHEMVHMAFPNVVGQGREHHWIEEGMATYIEPIARAQIGRLKVDQVWGDMARYMPQGLPREGDQGLDHTHTWGRTYWGGALFWLLADVEIRERTHNRKGLEDAMRGILDAGGNIEQDWPIERVLETGDRATGTTVLMDLYNQMKATPVETDLAALWTRLGIEVNGHAVKYNDHAPLAKIRKAITARPKDRGGKKALAAAGRNSRG
jgi:hypothetical protein